MVRNVLEYPITGQEKRDAVLTALTEYRAQEARTPAERRVIGDLHGMTLATVHEEITDETQETISAWGRATFDDNSDAIQCATRMNVEVAELLLEVAGDDPSLNALLAENCRIADLINQRVNQLPPERRSNVKPGALTECADVLIVLFQVADRVGGRLLAMVDKKMVVNRGRSWAKTKTGRFQHT